MKSPSQHFVVALMLITLTSCEVSSLQSTVSSRRDGGQPAAGAGGSTGSEQPGNPVNTVQTENGAMLSKDSTDVMKMSGTSSDVIINPGSLTVDTQVSIADYKRSDPNYIAHELGLESGEVEAVGVTQVKGSTTESLAKPMTITLEIGTNLLEFFLSEPYYFVVCTALKSGQPPKVWTIASEDIVVAGNFLQFQTKEFGVFEVFKAYRPVLKVKEMNDAAMNAFAEPLAVSSLSTAALGAGRTVTVAGQHLGEDTRVVVDGHSAAIKSYTSEQVSFTVPELNAFGLRTLKIMNRYNTITKPVFYKGSKTDLPLIARDPAEVCKGVGYYDREGEKQLGTKVCALADAQSCSAATKDGCLASVQYTAIDPSTVSQDHLMEGYRLAGVSGRLNYLDGLMMCDHDGQVNCRTNGVYMAADANGPDASHIRFGVSLAGVVGTYPAPRPSCDDSTTTGCLIPPASTVYTAVDGVELNSAHIRKSVTINGIVGKFPSAQSPLYSSPVANFNPTDAPSMLASGALFEFYDREGRRYAMQGDNDLASHNIAKDVNVYGVNGTFKVDTPTEENASEDDLRWGYTFKNLSSGKIKTNCRSLVPGGESNLPENNISGSVYTEPSQDPWGNDGQFACRSEGWKVYTPNCDPSSQNNDTRCLVQDHKTLLMWTTAGLLEGKADQAQTHCDTLNYQGYSDWRVPTQKEAMQAVINGMSSLSPDLFRFANSRNFYWTSTIPRTQVGSSNPPYWYIDMTSGLTSQDPDASFHYLCVRGG